MKCSHGKLRASPGIHISEDGNDGLAEVQLSWHLANSSPASMMKYIKHARNILLPTWSPKSSSARYVMSGSMFNRIQTVVHNQTVSILTIPVLAACAILTASFLAANCASAADAIPLLGRQLDDFSAKDYRGRSHSLSEYSESRVVVLAFLGTECPLAKL